MDSAPPNNAPSTDAAQEQLQAASQPYIGRWNQLVSTTNWEKGRIIYQWREALVASEAPAADYSDEAWTRLIGGVTGQHVGRLRRVYQRFGQVYSQYEELYWSHFQASLDWDDAEMWLEGAVQNAWSVSQLRRQRWETLGGVEEQKPHDEDIVSGELDEDFEPAVNQEPIRKTISPSVGEAQSGPLHEGPDFGDEDRPTAGRPASKSGEGASIYADNREEKTIDFVRPFENLADLPDDLAEAFESFKLAVLHHKTDGWQQISRDDVLGCLDALKELALAPSDD